MFLVFLLLFLILFLFHQNHLDSLVYWLDGRSAGVCVMMYSVLGMFMTNQSVSLLGWWEWRRWRCMGFAFGSFFFLAFGFLVLFSLDYSLPQGYMDPLLRGW